MDILMRIVLVICCVILITFLLALFEEKVNFAWVLCAFMILEWMIDGEIAYLLPASIFAVAGAIVEHAMKDKKKNKKEDA